MAWGSRRLATSCRPPQPAGSRISSPTATPCVGSLRTKAAYPSRRPCDRDLQRALLPHELQTHMAAVIELVSLFGNERHSRILSGQAVRRCGVKIVASQYD